MTAAAAPGRAPVRAWPVLATSFSLVGLIALADGATGYELRLSILYLLPIAWAAWRGGSAAGALIAAAAAAAWLVSFGTSHPYADPVFYYWEGALTGATYLVVALLIARLRAALARSDERFVTVLEGLETAVMVEDARAGAPLYANRRYRDALGAVGPLPAEAGEVQDARSGRWYLAHARPLRWTDGRAATLRTYADVTEERVARETLARHRDAVHRTARLVALGQFASAVAHELSQPLAAIAAYNSAGLRLLQGGGGAPGELAAALQKCRDQARRASAIIQRLRDVLRQPAPAFAEVDLSEVARAAVELAAPEAREAGVAIEPALAPGLPAVRADRLLLEQVALNLLRNALEAVQDLPAARRRVRVATARAGAGVQIEVSDRGEGVPLEICERLFDAFATTKAGGLGLGLAICRSVIEAHGGTIRYESAPGAVFTVVLPAA